jgi:hypothetical protein
MIHSASRSYNEAFAGVGLLNHPQRISVFWGAGVFTDRESALTKVIASNKRAASTTRFPGCLNISFIFISYLIRVISVIRG